MTSFYEQPILNSPYKKPTHFHPLDEHGQPLDQPPVAGRRPSKFVVPVPKAKRKGAGTQGSLDLETYDDNAIINEIRRHVDDWRDLPGGADWGVTPTTQRLLEHWRHHPFANQKPFFCQVEAVETLIWLIEVARTKRQYAHLWRDIEARNLDANPELLRLALKMATGAGKTTVMAMLIAWQTLNAVRAPGSERFSKAFLIVTPGITIKDRLQVLLPEHPDSYYKSREIVPADMLAELQKASIVITNYHSFQHRETMQLSKVGRAFLKGNSREPVLTRETDGQMLERACGKLLSFKNVVVINDEAHHCYRERALSEEEKLDREAAAEAKENNEAARLWIAGIEALTRKIGVRHVYDLSATPFFLRGSGYQEGTLFPWVVSDFSLMDAIECGIVKLPRVPVADNSLAADDPIYRDLWKHIGKDLLRTKNPLDLPPMLMTALHALYSNYEEHYREWEAEGVGIPPVFIVVCQNTAISRLIYDWIAGFERESEDGETINEERNFHPGALKLFSNYDEHGQPIARPNTILIDSKQFESGDAIDPAFRKIAEAEIEAFKAEQRRAKGAGETSEPSDGELLREVMNSVGRTGKLGEQIRCVVSVSMLTEGWDANTVTHILGVRAFGTQLLCEQVVGRGLRRLSYDLNEADKFEVEYAQVMGIPFAFTGPAIASPPTKPKTATHVHAVRERADLEIVFPRVAGFRVDMPDETLSATFTEDSRFKLDPTIVGPCEVLMQGIVGEAITLTPAVLAAYRPSEISFNLAKHLLYRRFRDEDGFPRQHLFPQIQRICRRWLDEGWLELSGGVQLGAVLYLGIADTIAEIIANAIIRSAGDDRQPRAVLDSYEPQGSTALVNFQTTKAVWKTDARRSHISHVTLDSEWEGELARVLEAHPKVLSYAKNQGMQFEVPYRIGRSVRRYIPDFLVRLDVGGGEVITLVLETKGFRSLDAQLKADTMHTLWVPGVNAIGTFGKWTFAEFREVFAIQEEFGRLAETLTNKEVA